MIALQTYPRHVVVLPASLANCRSNRVLPRDNFISHSSGSGVKGPMGRSSLSDRWYGVYQCSKLDSGSADAAWKARVTTLSQVANTLSGC
jgi:hypothetical protein